MARTKKNAELYGSHRQMDDFEYYSGPLGADVRQSIRGPRVDNRDEPGGDGPILVVPVARNKHKPPNHCGEDL